MNYADSLRRNKNLLSVFYRNGGARSIFKRCMDKYFWHFLLTPRLRSSRCDIAPRPPVVFQFEITQSCNLNCKMCSRASGNRSHFEEMNPDKFRFYLRRLGTRPEHISLNGVGEPLVSPHLFAIMEFLQTRNITCSFYTNGLALNQHAIQRLSSFKNLTFIGVSCDSPEKAVFENLRRGADFDKFKSNIESLTRHLVVSGSEVQVAFNFVINAMNIHQLRETIAFASRVGIDRMDFNDMIPNEGLASALDADIENLDLDGLIRFGENRGVAVNFNFRKTGFTSRICFMPFEYIMVEANGNIKPCCMIIDKRKAPNLGNLNDQSLKDIWNNPAYRSFRKEFLTGKQDYCRGCRLYFAPNSNSIADGRQ